MSSISKKILAVYFLVLVLGLTLSTLIYINGNAVSAVINSLVENNLPRLNAYSTLRVAIFAQKPALYEYYANTDRDAFIKRYESIQREVQAGLRTIQVNDEGKQLLLQIESEVDQIAQLAVALDRTLTAPFVDWDEARAILEQVSQSENKITPMIEALVRLNQQSVFENANTAHSRTALMVKLVIVFSLVIFIVAMLIGYYVNAYLSESAERRRLAMFPERSPSPVMRLAWDGRVTYANPATTDLTAQLGLPDAMALLPEDFTSQLAELKSSREESMTLEYTRQGHILDYFIHALGDLHVFHVYISDITERKRAEENLVYQAYYDELAGLPNRRMFGECLGDAINEQAGTGRLAIALLRADRMQRILESQGYEASDELLRTLALRLNTLLKNDRDVARDALLFRFEGASLSLLLPNLVDPQQLHSLGDKLLLSMREPLTVNGQDFFFSLSIGASILPEDGADAESLIRNAESAVNQVSLQGGNAFEHYTEDMNARAERWLLLETGLRRAIELNELALRYQPQIAIASHKIIGVEALLRWYRTGQGFVSPAEFIPLAEESGLIIPIGEWVLRTACTQARQWQAAGFTDLIVAVNISARQFQHPRFVELVTAVIEETGIDPRNLELEITESVAMFDAEKTIATLNALRALNLQLSIDDFGTGYSSLSYLKRFPINKLKVDQSFVRNMNTDANDASIHYQIHHSAGSEPEPERDRRRRGNGSATCHAEATWLR